MEVNLWLILFINLIGKTTGATFGYSKRSQHIWPQDYKGCAGKKQSPIAISSHVSVALPLPALELNGYHDYLSGPITLKNNGHSVAMKLNNKMWQKRIPHIFGAMLNVNEKYELDGLHFHWGMKNSRGSEHVFNGVRFPMEMHIVHRNLKYSNIDDALEYDDGLAVLGIFFQLQEENNEKLGPIIKKLPSIRWLNHEDFMNVSIVLASLMPLEVDTFYTYRGSLTTPPCSESVTWIIFPTPVPISFKQMDQFRILSDGEDVLADNYRHLQDIGNRKIYVRRLLPSFASDPDMIDLNISRYNWYWQ